MDKATLLALVENNPKGKKIEPVDLPDLSNDPDIIKRAEEVKQKYFQPECFPPEVWPLIEKMMRDTPSKD